MPLFSRLRGREILGSMYAMLRIFVSKSSRMSALSGRGEGVVAGRGLPRQKGRLEALQGCREAESDCCPVHDPMREGARRGAASKAARSRPDAELKGVKDRLQALANRALCGELQRADALVVSHVLNLQAPGRTLRSMSRGEGISTVPCSSSWRRNVDNADRASCPRPGPGRGSTVVYASGGGVGKIMEAVA
jgi:hypothetical protein